MEDDTNGERSRLKRKRQSIVREVAIRRCTRQRRQSESAVCSSLRKAALSVLKPGSAEPSDLVPNTATDWLVRTWTTTMVVVVPCRHTLRCSCNFSPMPRVLLALCSLSRIACCASSTSCQDTTCLLRYFGHGANVSSTLESLAVVLLVSALTVVQHRNIHSEVHTISFISISILRYNSIDRFVFSL